MAAPPCNFRQLIREAVDSIPAIDAHAHNLVRLDSHFPLARCFSESEGDALSFAPHSLSFKRSVRDIALLYECPPSLDGVDSYRKSQGLASVAAKCFGAANISAVLLDDGLVFDKMLDLQSHKAFVPGAVARILRIEHLAETILNDEKSTGEKVTLDSFTEVFLTKIKSVVDKIVGLKSIAAYRSGLEIDPCVSEIKAEEGLLQELNGSKPIRITNKSLIDYIFTRSLELAVSLDLPMQIHTGFGDKDLDLRKSNPLHLRAVLEDKRFAKSKIVLLHASYPFSKEASYLASAYSQVYLDFGLAIPKLSVHGMISSLKELLELAPINKVMFSTDGYAFPETFYLGAKRSRDVVFTVLLDACGDGDLTLQEALQAVKDIFRENAMRLYKLNYSAGLIESESIVTQYTVPKHIGNSQNGDVVFVRIIWVDASGQHRCRVVPAGRFYEVVKTQGVGLTVVSMGMTSFMDGPAEGSNLTAVGEIRLVPDMTTISRLPWSTKEEMVLAAMHVKPGEAWEYCPRSVLLRVSRFLQKEFNLVMNAGFENEFYILKKIERNGNEEWGPFDLTPYCSTSSFDAASSMLQEACSFLQSLNISVEQLHAEAGKGQFEMAFKYLPCNLAADHIIYAREVIRSVARKHGLLATFVPKFDLKDIGSGSHVHISLSENGQNVFIGSEDDPQTRYGISKIGQSFLAGVYHHLPSILAFTAPLPNSYDRIKPDTWSGAYHCWGKENREAPLRTACPPGVPLELVSNFEIKSFDGCANPHLGLAAILAAGLDGLRSSLTLPEPTETNPSDYSTKLKRLPKDLGEAVSALEQDVALKELIGEKLVTAVIAIRKIGVDWMASLASGGGGGGSHGGYDYSFKILLIGDSGVGKSSLLVSFITSQLDDLAPTIGVDFKIKHLEVGGKKLKLTIWDTAGQERFRTLTSSYYRSAQGIILVYDVTRRETFTNLSDVWAKEIELYSTNKDCVKMLVGNKVDKDSEREVTKEEGLAFAQELGCLFLECSAKTRSNVEKCFEELALKILEVPSLLEEGSSVKRNILKQKQENNSSANGGPGCCS